MLLRAASSGAAAEKPSKRLQEALLEAAEVWNPRVGPLLGMAATESARLGCGELLGALCAHAASHLHRWGGREVAALLAATQRLRQPSPPLLRAAALFCAAPREGAFASLRDISALALALHQDLSDPTPGVDHAWALRGLSGEALPHLISGWKTPLPPRDVAEFAHAMSHALGAGPPGKRPLAEVAMDMANPVQAAFALLRRDMHHANARDVAMAAGAAAAAWPFLAGLRAAVLRPCLLDAAQAARFRGSDFNLQDLALIAMAFAKTQTACDSLWCLLDERIRAEGTRLTDKELSFLLWAAASVEGWSWTPFAASAVTELRRRNMKDVAPQDLSAFAQSLSRLASVDDGGRALQEVLREAKRRRLPGFSTRMPPGPEGEGWGAEGAGTPTKPPPDGPGDEPQTEPPPDGPDDVREDVAASAGTARTEPPHDRPGDGREDVAASGKDVADAADGALKPPTPLPPGFLAATRRKARAGRSGAAEGGGAWVGSGYHGHGHDHRHGHEHKLSYSHDFGHSKPSGGPWSSAPRDPRDVVREVFLSSSRQRGRSGCRDGCTHDHDQGAGHGEAHGGHMSNYHGHGHGHGCGDFKDDGLGQSHGHGHGEVSEFLKAACDSEACCPTFTPDLDDGGVKARLNAHCNFPGHCLQMKNTFIHIPCHDSESETDCMVCRMRASSCDDGWLRASSPTESLAGSEEQLQ
mmetsp:Transcript_25339/g.75419  ORF Transcript_25339/g.75419 Transcript_25339/m.75419 type:complete len:696 (-) Transcript_25339:111-2198(-)